MTRDEIIKMAVAARLLEIVDDAYLERFDWEPYVVRFFRAAYEAGAAAEREACGDDGAMVTETLESQGWKK
jgi:hypothetical protein